MKQQLVCHYLLCKLILLLPSLLRITWKVNVLLFGLTALLLAAAFQEATLW